WARTSDGERRLDRLGRSDALDGGVDAHAIRHLQDCLDCRLAALGDDVRGTERPGECLAGRVPAEGNDPGGVKSPSSNDGAEADCTVPDDGGDAATLDAGAHRGVM